MKQFQHQSADYIRASFARAMSKMYREEVPAYGTLVEIVERANREALFASPALKKSLDEVDGLHRISEERHGAIRLGTAEELCFIRRLFAVMGMLPVGYYDLSVAGIPVHSTAFRPIEEASLKTNPFRVFTSLLRLDLIEDANLRTEAVGTLAKRSPFTPITKSLVEKAEQDGGLSPADAELFVQEALETFRWHKTATIPFDLYQRLLNAHRLIADVVSFAGPHINHLTPRTLDIDEVQRLMPQFKIVPKESVEGPPPRKCPILLRQTSFKALEEAIAFPQPDGTFADGTHTARFGEIEQRGIALTSKGRTLYDELLAAAQIKSHGKPAPVAAKIAAEVFADFPDDYQSLRQQGLAYFEYFPTDAGTRARLDAPVLSIEELLKLKWVDIHPIVYEDFLPVSAAGIFQSNLGDEAKQGFSASPNKAEFERALGCKVIDEFSLYAAMERDSIQRCLGYFGQIARHKVA